MTTRKKKRTDKEELSRMKMQQPCPEKHVYIPDFEILSVTYITTTNYSDLCIPEDRILLF
jgi:hypothetical protein